MVGCFIFTLFLISLLTWPPLCRPSLWQCPAKELQCVQLIAAPACSLHRLFPYLTLTWFARLQHDLVHHLIGLLVCLFSCFAPRSCLCVKAFFARVLLIFSDCANDRSFQLHVTRVMCHFYCFLLHMLSDITVLVDHFLGQFYRWRHL